MRTIIKIILIIIAILLGEKQLHAQNAQIDSDIRIAERILEEIFRSPDQNSQFYFSGQKAVTGEYIPGMGVHFRINSSQPMVFGFVRDGNGNESERERENEIDQEWIENKMLEYYKSYAAQLRGIPDNERVRITYGSSFSGNRQVVFLRRGSDEREVKRTPAISAWSTMSEIKDFSSGDLSENQFRNRLTVVDLSNQEERRDLKIFASVMETALEEAETENLRVRGEPTYEYLPGYGVNYHIRVGTGSAFSFRVLENLAEEIDRAELDDVDIEIDLGEINLNTPDFEFNPDSLEISMRKMADSIEVFTERLEIDTAEVQRLAEEAQKQVEGFRQRFEVRVAEQDTIDLTGEAEQMLNELNQTLRDYGNTLSSLDNDDLLVVTVYWEGRNKSLPERTQISISKGDLLRGNEPRIDEIRRR